MKWKQHPKRPNDTLMILVYSDQIRPNDLWNPNPHIVRLGCLCEHEQK